MYRLCQLTGYALFFSTPLLAELVPAQQPLAWQVATAATSAGPSIPKTEMSAVSKCHAHGSSLLCDAGSSKLSVVPFETATTDILPSYTGCRSHGLDELCDTPTREEVKAVSTDEITLEDGGNGEPTRENCHFHAGVEHCVGQSEGQRNCSRTERDYNVPLRVGMMFVILATSTIGVFVPILLTSIFPKKLTTTFIILKQFGTGVIISTAFVHLFTHANLMFENECLGILEYEGTASAILMAGLFLSFSVDYAGQRFAQWHSAKKAASVEGTSLGLATRSAELVNVAMLEAGIVFHSLLIGLTLVVAGDTVFVTLTIVIIFHQMFEGIALGSRIAALGTALASDGDLHGYDHNHDSHPPESETSTSSRDKSKDALAPYSVPMTRKLLLAVPFALVTPIGMAIGIGVLHTFNGNSPATIITLGTLDALSAGILVWVGVVEMLAEDWMHGGELANANAFTTSLGMVGLLAGLAVMSLLGKWA